MSGMVLIADFLLIYQIYSINVCEGCVESSKRFVLDGTQDSNSKMHMLEERIQELVTELGQVETQLRTQHQSLQSSIDHLTRTTQQQASTISSLTSQLNNFKSGGGVFIRWGHHHCPDSDSEELYSEMTCEMAIDGCTSDVCLPDTWYLDCIAAGSHPSFTGGAADFLCLPGQNPDLKSPAYSGHAVIYGAEYGKSTFLGADGNDVPCAVCRSRSGTSSVMIPARTTCNSGWKRQYYGYLMTGNPSQPGSANFICVDVNRETVLGGEHMYVDKMIYPVEAKCGALPCPPYGDGYFLYCVVCTK